MLLDHMVSGANGLLAQPLAIELTESPARTTGAGRRASVAARVEEGLRLFDSFKGELE